MPAYCVKKARQCATSCAEEATLLRHLLGCVSNRRVRACACARCGLGVSVEEMSVSVEEMSVSVKEMSVSVEEMRGL